MNYGSITIEFTERNSWGRGAVVLHRVALELMLLRQRRLAAQAWKVCEEVDWIIQQLQTVSLALARDTALATGARAPEEGLRDVLLSLNSLHYRLRREAIQQAQDHLAVNPAQVDAVKLGDCLGHVQAVMEEIKARG